MPGKRDDNTNNQLQCLLKKKQDDMLETYVVVFLSFVQTANFEKIPKALHTFARK